MYVNTLKLFSCLISPVLTVANFIYNDHVMVVEAMCITLLLKEHKHEKKTTPHEHIQFITNTISVNYGF